MTIPQIPKRGGFTLIEIMIVVAIIGLILGVALPAFMKSRTQARKQVCISNLSQIESAKQRWGLENNKKDGDVAADGDLFGEGSFIKIKPSCPGEGTYDLKSIGTSATCTQEGHVLE